MSQKESRIKEKRVNLLTYWHQQFFLPEQHQAVRLEISPNYPRYS